MKKIVSLVLCLVMLLSMGSVMISATEGGEPAPAASDAQIFATFASSDLNINGKVDARMTLSALATKGKAKFGAAWNKDYLFISMTGILIESSDWQAKTIGGLYASIINLDSASVQIGEKVYSTETPGTADVAISEAETIKAYNTTSLTGNFYVEFAIDMAEVELVELDDGTVVIEDVVLTYNGADSENSFTGSIVLTDTEVVAKQDVTGRQDSNEHSQRTSGKYTFDQDGDGVQDAGKTTAQWTANAKAFGFAGVNVWIQNYQTAVVTDDNNPRRDAGATLYLHTTVLEEGLPTAAQEDLLITGLPVADLDEIVKEESVYYAWGSPRMNSNETNPARVLLSIGWGAEPNADSSVGYVIYNTANGLVLYDDLAKNSIELGVNQDEWFTIRFELDTQNDAKVYVNGEYLATMPASTNTKAFVEGIFATNGFATSIVAGNTLPEEGKNSQTASFYSRDPFICSQSSKGTKALNKLLGKEEIVTDAPATQAPSKPSTPNTTAPSGDNTPTTDNNTATQEPTTTEKKGCGSSIAGGAIALICTVGLAGVAFKKRKH